ncbi:MAG TPA: tetratricopeptide repeat protein [Sedimentisphaerales bacterium]|nr:tetratricopeptide repeat protein [Sedimentisphaerales bacterium]
MKTFLCSYRRDYGRLTWASFAVLGLLALLAIRPCVAADDHDHTHDPFEPTVTRDEARLLQQAMATAATDPATAVEMLRTKKLGDASAALDFALGNLYFQQEQFDAAAQSYQGALTKLPKFRSAIMNLGRVYLLQNQTDKAITLYQELVKDGQADADILLLLGHALLMQNHPVSAESAYRQSLLLRPKHADAMLGMAKSLMQQERYAEGLALVGEILQTDPTHAELWALRTNALLAMNANDRATRAIETAHRLGCADAEMLAALGDLYLHQDQPQDALRVYDEAFRTASPSVNRMLRAFEGFLMVNDQQGALRMLERLETARRADASSFGPKDQVKLLRLQGELAEQQGDSARAMALYEELLRIDPLDARSLLLLARGQWQKDQLEEAAMTCERAARIQGAEADALVLHAQIEVQREHYGRAVELLEAAQTFQERPHVQRYLEQVRRMAQ